MATDDDFQAELDSTADEAHNAIGQLHEDAQGGLDRDYWTLRTSLRSKYRRVTYEGAEDEQVSWFSG